MTRGPKPTSKQELLDELHRLTQELGKTPTRNEMNEHGEYSRGPYDRQFGSWNNALQEAELKLNKPTNVTQEDVIKDYQRVADELNKTPSQYEYGELGKYSQKVLKTKFEGMKTLQEQAGLEPLKNGTIQKECQICGKTYTTKHALKDTSRFCSRECEYKWKETAYKGSNNPNGYKRVELECEWCNQTFTRQHYEKNTARFCSQNCMLQWRSIEYSGENHPRWKGGKNAYRGPNWHTQREKALQRDNHTCQHCNATTDLNTHHITPYEDFNDYKQANQLQNLITLCTSCHSLVEWGTIELQTRLDNH